MARMLKQQGVVQRICTFPKVRQNIELNAFLTSLISTSIFRFVQKSRHLSNEHAPGDRSIAQLRMQKDKVQHMENQVHNTSKNKTCPFI